LTGNKLINTAYPEYVSVDCMLISTYCGGHMVISDDEAEQLLFFFNEELNTEEEKHKLKVERTTKDGPKILIWGKETNHNVSVAVVDRLRSLVIDKLKSKVISGNSEDTFDNVIKIIHNCKLKA
jgi:hypothetical protein